jgi:iron(III) transport system permease protein
MPAGGMRRLRLPRRIDPAMLLFLLAAAILVFIVVAPLVRLVISSLQDSRTGALTWNNYIAAYGTPRHITALLNTLMMGAGVVALSTVFAAPIAWACSRTDMPWRGFIRLSVVGAFVTPPYLGAIAWILLAGPNAGWINRIWVSATGADHGIVNIFSYAGIVLVMSTNLFFFLFVYLSSALDMVSSESEEAANILGASVIQTAFRITFPLIMPAFLGGLVVIFLQSIALFGVPALLSPAAKYPVVTTQLLQFFEYPLRVQVAAAYSVPLVAITVLLFSLQRLMLSRKGFVSVTGKGGERRPVSLGGWRWPVFGYALFVCVISVFLPWFILVQTAFSRAWGAGLSAANLTLANFGTILFELPMAREAMGRSLSYAAISAFCAIGLGLCIAYIVARRLVAGASLLAVLSMVPLVIPGIVLAIGFYATYAPPPLALYGTAAILILAFITRFLPLAYTSCISAIRNIHPEMEEAVRILGGSRMLVMRAVVAPLLKRPLVGAWILVFVPAAQELSTAVFLVGPRTRVMSLVLLDMSEQGNLEVVAAASCMLLLVILVVVAVGFRIIGRDFMLRGN